MNEDVKAKIIGIWLVMLVITAIAIPIVIRTVFNKKKDKSGKINQVKVLKRYNFYSTNMVTRKRFHSIVKSYNALMCMTELQIKAKSVKIFERAIFTSVCIPLFLLITLKDPVVALLGVLIAMVYYNITVDKEIDRIYIRIINEVSYFIQSLTLNYMETDNIPASIIDGERGEYLGLIIDDMYKVLTSVDSKKNLRDFISRSPLKVLCELLEVCQITNEYGDSHNARGESKFVEQLSVIEREVNLEISTLYLQKRKFSMLDKVALSGIVFMPIVDWYLLSQIPGTSIIIKGIFGMATKVVILLLTIVAYYVIATINKKSIVNSTDFSESIYTISQDKRFHKFLESVKPKSYKDTIKVEATLQSALSSHSLDTLYTSKVVYTLFMFLLGVILSIMFIFTARASIYSNTGTLGFIPILVEKRVQDDIDLMDEKYMTMDEKPMGDDLLVFVETHVRGLNMMDIRDQAARLQKKWKTYTNIYYKWYYILVAYLMGVIGWFIPDVQLKLRRFLVKFEADEDASQLQTVMVTLAGTGLSVYEILYRLLDLSTIHKSNLSYSCQTFVRSPEYSLEVLSDSSNIPEFKRMCIKLRKSIFSIPVEDAFRNIVMEKEQALTIKKIDAEHQLNKKSNLANMLSWLPVACVLLLQVLVPLFVLGFAQIMDMQSTLGGM